MYLVAYFITCDPMFNAKGMYDTLARVRNVASCELTETSSFGDPPYLTVTLIGEAIDRKLYFVSTKNRVPFDSRLFDRYTDAFTWATGKDNTSWISMPSIRYHEYEENSILSWVAASPRLKHHIVPEIKRIERNIKKDALYTTVIWADRSEPTVVKCAEGDSPDIYFAVASAIAIKMYGSNSAYKRMIKDKMEEKSNGSK